jgi:Arc/MetJ-type ribon-helix-helix transcriptional regulator
MAFSFSTDNEQFLVEQVARGRFPDRDRALDAAITLLREQTAVLDTIDRGRAQLDAGDYSEYDDQSLADRFEALKLRVSERAANRRGDA